MSESTHFARFAIEAREHLAIMSQAMIAMECAPGDRRECVERLLRATHSLKGGAGFVGQRRIEELSHAMESVVENIRDGLLTINPDIIDALLFSFDRITALVDDVEHSNESDIADPLGRLQALLAASSGPASPAARRVVPPAITSVASQAGVATQPGEFMLSARVLASALDPGASLYGVKFDWYACEVQLGLSPTDVAQRLEGVGIVLDSKLELSDRPLSEALPMPPFWYRCIIASTLKPEEFASRLGIPIAGIARLERVSSPSVPLSSPPPVQAAASAAPAASAPTSLRVSVGIIDRMMELAGELVLVRNQALRTAPASDAPMRRLMRRLDSVTSDLHNAALRMRMQPVATLFDRFPRLVRDLARQLNKQIELAISGSEVELDKTVLELLADPLTHLVRNCCDHGIETPEKRRAAGKQPTGTIRLSASQDRGQIVIEVRDDGRGIDTAAVKRKALEQGLKSSEELDRLNPRQVCDLIFLSGFSTAAAVTDVSGRGVGMDVVKTNLEQIGGVVEIDSTAGQGAVFSLRLPLTLAIMPCLMIKSGDARYAVPQRDIEEILLLEPGSSKLRIECSHDEEVVRLRNVLLPAVRLNEVFRRSEPFDARAWADIIATYHGSQAEPTRGYAAVVRSGSRRFAMLFDEVLENEDIVVKPLNALLRPLNIYSGSTILGDGGVSMILSSEGIARHSGVMQKTMAQAVPELPAAEETAETLGVLLTRYGGDALLAIPLADIRRVIMIPQSRIERAGDRELVNTDGITFNLLRLEAFLKLMPTPAPWYFLIVPRRAGTPIAIPVTEIVDTETLSGPLDRQAFVADGVMGSALVRGHIALVLDLAELVHMWELGHDRKMQALPEGPGRRILIVEDTQFFRTLVANCLKDAGFQVTVANDGKEGLAELQNGSFDLVVSDIEMPVMDGLAFARHVRADPRWRSIRMLALTTLGSPEDRRRSLEAGFNAHEVKFEPGGFLGAVNALLGRSALALADGGEHSHD